MSHLSLGNPPNGLRLASGGEVRRRRWFWPRRECPREAGAFLHRAGGAFSCATSGARRNQISGEQLSLAGPVQRFPLCVSHGRWAGTLRVTCDGKLAPVPPWPFIVRSLTWIFLHDASTRRRVDPVLVATRRVDPRPFQPFILRRLVNRTAPADRAGAEHGPRTCPGSAGQRAWPSYRTQTDQTRRIHQSARASKVPIGSRCSALVGNI
jgi:hypothetical protein